MSPYYYYIWRMVLGGKFLEKKISRKRYWNDFLRWDYKAACYTTANLSNINPLYGLSPQTLTELPNSILYIVSIHMDPEECSVGFLQ